MEAELLAWENSLQSSQKAEFNLLRPHPSFRYPPYPELGPNVDLDSHIRSLLWPESPPKVSLHENLETAFLKLIEGLRGTGLAMRHIGIQEGPLDPGFMAALNSAQLSPRFLSRDPARFEGEALKDLDLVLFSNPNRMDGFFYPEELYLELIRRVRKSSPKAFIVSEESANLFSFNDTTPGSAAILAKARNSCLFLLSTIDPYMSPLGPSTSWLLSDFQVPMKGSLAADLLLPTARALQAFKSKQGPAMMEFNRRMLAVRLGLRLFCDILRGPLEKELIRIPHWPETGFNLVLDLSIVLSHRKMDIQQWCQDLMERKSMIVLPGPVFGIQDAVGLNFAAPHSYLRRAAQALSEFCML